MANRTAEEILQDHTAMGHSAVLITGVIAGDQMADDTNADKKDCVARNVEHLELMKAMKKEDGETSIWTNEDFTGINSAITAGNTYIS